MNNQTQLTRPMTKLIRFAGIPMIALSVLPAYAIAQQPKPDDALTAVQSAPTAPAASVAAASVLPSSLVRYLHAQDYLQPQWKQDDIASPLLRMARTEGLNDHERFFLGQLNFMAFEGDAAYDMFAEFTDRDDWYGWSAREHHAIIDARFYENFERLERSVKNARENFGLKPEFADMTGFGERSLCWHWAEEGEHDRAIELALRTIAQTPRDAPYGTFRVISACYSSFEQTGRESELFELAQTIVDDLAAALMERKAVEDQHPAYDATLYENKIEAQWYHRSMLAPFNYQNHNYKKMIGGIEKFLSCRRDNASDTCSG